MSVHQPIGIFLAAGRGSRFSPEGNVDKLLAPLPNGIPIALASLRALQSAVTTVIAVVRPQADELAELLSAHGALVLRCPHAIHGMGHSLAFAAAHWANLPTPMLVALADMPWISAQTMSMVADALTGSRIVAPTYQGRRGHPVGFPPPFVPKLMELQGDVGARDLLRSSDVLELECTDPAILRDVDHPTDLALHAGFTNAS